MTAGIFSYMPLFATALLNMQLGGLYMGFLPESMLLFAFAAFCFDIIGCTVKIRKTDRIFWLVALYVATDLSGMIIRWDISNFISKYRVTAAMAFVSLMLAEILLREGFLKKFFLFMALSGIVLSAAVIINTFVLTFQPIEYIRRLSLRTDYNMFATALLASYICAAAYSVKSKRPCRYFFVFSCVIIPVMVLACSRRVWLMLSLVIPASAAVLLLKERRRAAYALAAAAFVTVTATKLLSLSMNSAYESGAPLGRAESSGAASVSQRLETVKDISFTTKRKVIWDIACEEFEGFSFLERLIGRGAFYDTALYDEPRFNDRLDAVYSDRQGREGALSAHSCILADLLNGGYLKLFLLLAVLTDMGKRCLVETLKAPETGIFKLMLFAMVVSNSLISNRYGILYDRWFWFLKAILTYGGGVPNEKTDSYGNGSPSRR